ncbi:probable serine/threonine-protein kinase DDB_G0278665 [Punica granatum]|uniref:VQ domain-containing protein n=2 Tax=Punica granatum TaxID=22663 RepID=A0A218VYJ4_PUNGR|nr:probable serine/threonine-protein kinase DDB_G0278665 [Punica granatum]OWM65624.1 hypothetical protein CDL15_Pgr017121 [Punica granatum]PKI61189.1 hypothetical protein CRG98_018420 [Punica granatum]
MDSVSSGSMQSSSGGDDEYDSRGESISAFLNSNPNPSHLGDGTITGLPRQHHQLQPPQMALHSPSPSMFDPLMCNFFDPMATRSASLTAGPNSILNLDMAAWSKSPRPDPNCTDLGGFGLAPMQLQPLPGYSNQGQGRGCVPGPTSFPVLSEPEGLKQLGSISGSAANEQVPVTGTTTTTTNNGVSGGNTLGRNPKKRSRASRRAPTTVLTTDTTNFRAMVQEFTGIPAPPFTAPPFQRSRLDLFGSASGAPSYLLRPFAQKIQPQIVPPFAPPSSASSNSSSSSFPTSMIDALASTAAGNNVTNTDLGLLKPSPSFLNQNASNPVLDFQSLFQAPGGQKYPVASSSMFPPKTLGSSDIPGSDHNHHMKIGVLEEFGLGHGQVSTQLQAGLPNLESSDRTLSENNNNNNDDDNPHPNWHADGGRTNDGSSQGMLRPLGGNFGRIGSSDRGPGSGGTRGEGMVESWICSSD